MLTLALALALTQATSDKIATAKGDLEIHPVEHATFVLKWDGKTIFVDPVGGGDRFKDFGKPDLVLVTDIHGDHLHADTLKAVAAPETRILAPAAVIEKMGDGEKAKAAKLANGEKTKVGEIEVEAVPMYNLTEERKSFHTKGRGNGYVLTLGGKRVYISGDTEDIPEMRGLKDIDAAFVCMNLPFTMEVEKAADAVLQFKPKVVYPYHYRGRPAMSDVGKFKELVAKDKSIEVRLLKWYK
jgi:L-ascorbate metabolism protein UlaG (beta-lactamase superfamily)